jgi:hypothetical protein
LKDEGCDNCEKGNGMYAECVYIPGKYGGACGNCKRGDRGAWCSVCDRDRSAKDEQDAELEEADQTRERKMPLKGRGLRE